MRLARLTLAALLLLSNHGVPKAAPRKPYGGSAAVYCDPVVIKQYEAAWEADGDGELRQGKWEYGFRIDWIGGMLEVGPLVMGDTELRVAIPYGRYTVAIAHVHPNQGVSAPSAGDMKGSLPDYVVSRDGLFVTDPKTHTYRFLRPFDRQFRPEGCPR
jgi:hypothetical protein